ncbi:MAG: Crp/Fnr family transcriptional regulator [Bdellovibrionales bacterium]|nr:Crp/Fnr family transcriptional regulator [Bdellovibrionales bacterium]
MGSILISSGNKVFVDSATQFISDQFPNKNLLEAKSLSDLSLKLSNQKFESIIIDYKTCPIKEPVLNNLIDLGETKSLIIVPSYGEAPPKFYDQGHVHVAPLKKDGNQPTKDLLDDFYLGDGFLWGKGICEINLDEGEILCKNGSAETAIYLVKTGGFTRVAPEGRILDKKIEPGQVIGELTYFEKKPKPWSVIATQPSLVVRISFKMIDKEVANLPPWVKAMFSSLANRALRYANVA